MTTDNPSVFDYIGLTFYDCYKFGGDTEFERVPSL